jgi:hypothetical protein
MPKLHTPFGNRTSGHVSLNSFFKPQYLQKNSDIYRNYHLSRGVSRMGLFSFFSLNLSTCPRVWFVSQKNWNGWILSNQDMIKNAIHKHKHILMDYWLFFRGPFFLNTKDKDLLTFLYSWKKLFQCQYQLFFKLKREFFSNL